MMQNHSHFQIQPKIRFYGLLIQVYHQPLFAIIGKPAAIASFIAIGDPSDTED